MTIAELDRRPVLDESNPDAARPAGSDPALHADAGATITPYMFSLSTRKLTLGTCLLASIACATQTPAAADGAPRPTASRFGDLTDVVFANDDEARLSPTTGDVRYPEAERHVGAEAALAYVFVLDRTGQPEYASVSIIGNAAPGFVDVACKFVRDARFAPVHRDGIARRAFVVGDLTFTLEPQHGAETRVHVQPVNVRRLRRMFAAKGPAATAEALEKQRHCG